MPPLADFEICNLPNQNSQEDPPRHHEKIGQHQYNQLNEKQKEIVDKILEVVISEDKTKLSNTCFYLDGPGGSGKTYVYTTLYHLLKSKGKKICTMSFTGVSAILLPEGKTVHRSFGLPVPLFSESTSHIKI